MAHHGEPMDIDGMDSEFDNKENTFHHSNVLPCTEKGYEELDVSELNMKLRYSITPASSPMSKSYTACIDNRTLDIDDSLNLINENGNLTRSLNSMMSKNDSVIKSLKTLPLQSLPTEQFVDNNRNTSVLRQLDTTTNPERNNVTVTISGANDIDDNASLPSSSASVVHTPEATTPTKDKDSSKTDGGSPIMRGLKTVLNMFRSSQSPIPTSDGDHIFKQEVLSSAEYVSIDDDNTQIGSQATASTPVATHRSRDASASKRNSPYKESIVFNDDLEKELLWNDDTTVIFSQEKIPIHKLFFQQAKSPEKKYADTLQNNVKNSTVECMEISFNDSNVKDKTKTDVMTSSQQNIGTESDSEFLDCETTFTKNESQIQEEPENVSNIQKTDDIKENNLPHDIPTINAKENISNINETLTPNTLQGILEVNASINSDNTVQGPTHSAKKIPEEQEQEHNIAHKVVPHNLVALTEEVPLINETTENEQISTTENMQELSLEIVSQKKDLDKENIDNKQPFVNIVEGREIVESQEFIQNKDIEPCDVDLPIEPKLETFQDQDLNPFNDSNNLYNNMTPEIYILDNKVNRSVNYIANSITLCNNNTQPQICDKIIQQPLDDPIENAEQIKLNDVAIDSPANIPLPLEDDIEMEVNMLPTADMLVHKDIPVHENLSPDIQENINTEIKLYDTEPIDQILINPIIEATFIFNTIKNDSCVPEILASNILMEKDEPTPQYEISHVGPDIITSHDVLEPIEVPNEEDNYDRVHNDVQEIESINQNLNEMQILPDFISETTTIENVENADISLECAEQVHSSITDSENMKQYTNPDIPEIVSLNVDTEINKDIPNDSEYNNDTSQFFSIDITNQVNNFVNEITATVNHDKNNYVVPESLQADDILKDIETNKEEKQLEVLKNESNMDKKEVTRVDVAEIVAKTKPSNNFEDIESTIVEQTAVPCSPPITSKGYNFNFDDIDDPFATKTKISLSPTPETPSKFTEPIADKITENIELAKKEINKNRRRSQPDRKKQTVSRKKLNATFDNASTVKAPSKNIQINVPQIIKVNQPASDFKSAENLNNEMSASSNTDNTEISVKENNDVPTEILKRCSNILSDIIPNELDDVDSHIQVDVISTSSESILGKHTDTHVVNKSSIESITVTNQSKTSLSEQSTYYSAGTSPNESIISRNVFNLPEIDDMNFNPFATKSKMRLSPSPTPEICDPFVTRSKMRCSPDSSMVALPDAECLDSHSDFDEKKLFTLSFDKNSEDKMETEPMEKDSSTTSNTTISSKATDDKNLTVREVNTEDEDTIEGPFLEPEDHTDDKMSDIDSENIDMMQFNDLPVQENEENLEGGELFIDAEAFEFLLNQNKRNVVADSGKESLFLKFDPLFAKRISSDGVLAALNKLQKRQSTPRKAEKPPQKSEISPIPGPSTLNVTYEGDINRTQENHEDLNITVSKPTMVVTPAVNPVAAPRNRSMTPTRSNRRSITFTSPAMAVIDRLLSLSANNSLVGNDVTTHVSREQNDADIALTQLRELLAEKEIHVYNLRSESKELKDRLSTMESQMRILETDSQERLKKINDLNDRLVEKTKINKSMAAVVEEYERTIASLIAEIEQDKKRNAEERIRLINERDEQTAHLASMEVSFSDLHSKYEKSKQVILSCKANEDTYKKSIKEFEESLTKMQSNYELLKQHATSKLNHANLELEKMNKAHEAEVLKLNAMVKRKDLHITSLEETLAQKTKANEELAAICDELINKVG